MERVFLETSVVIGLVFRHRGEREACSAAIPSGASRICSRYVQYEVARGFLASLILLHNRSFEYQSFADLHFAAHSGQRIFRHYQMHTWLGAFDDFEAALGEAGLAVEPSQKLECFRAKLRGWIRRGWKRMQDAGFASVIDDIRCREPLNAPVVESDGMIVQELMVRRCGEASACGLPAFVGNRHAELGRLADRLESMPGVDRDQETLRRIESARRLLAMPGNSSFVGKDCHRCGDALIAMECPAHAVIVTKNAKHLNPIARVLGKRTSIAMTATSTRGQEQGRA